MLEDGTGDDLYSPFVVVVNRKLPVFISLRDVNPAIVQGTVDDLVVIVTNKGSTVTRTIPFADMMFVGSGLTGQRNTPFENELRFVHESTDGQTNPLTEA